MPRVAVLLSTYNGDQFLNELVESLLSQEIVDFDILIRDDGSQDATLLKLKYFESISNRIRLFEDNFGNIGPSQSFHNLMKIAVATKEYDYYSFSDQDDIWMPKKLISGIEHISQNSSEPTKPILYASQVNAVDHDKNTINYKKSSGIHFGYKNSIIENSAIGATIILNSAAARILAENSPCFSVSYDAWYYLVISYVGSTYLDERTFIQYRRHDKTHTEFSTGVFRKSRIFRFLKSRHENFFFQAYFFQQSEIFKLASVERQKYLNDFVNGVTARLVPRLKFVCHFRFFRKSRIDGVVLKFSISMKRFSTSNLPEMID